MRPCGIAAEQTKWMERERETYTVIHHVKISGISWKRISWSGIGNNAYHHRTKISSYHSKYYSPTMTPLKPMVPFSVIWSYKDGEVFIFRQFGENIAVSPNLKRHKRERERSDMPHENQMCKCEMYQRFLTCQLWAPSVNISVEYPALPDHDSMNGIFAFECKWNSLHSWYLIQW